MVSFGLHRFFYTISRYSTQTIHRLGCPAPGWDQRVSCCKLAADLARRQRCGPSEITFVRRSHPAPVQIYRDQNPVVSFLRLSSLL